MGQHRTSGSRNPLPVISNFTLLIATFILIHSVNVSMGATDCERDIEEVLTDCTKRHLDDSSSTFPRSVSDLNVKCMSFKEAGICLKNYAYRCMDDQTRISTGLLLSGVRLVGGAFCGSQAEKEEFLQHAGCLNATAIREIQCRRSFMQVLRVAKFARPDMKVALSCCYYNEFTRCLDSAFIEAGDRCSNQAFDYFREMTNRFRVNTMDLLCGAKYQRHSERCDDIVGSPISGRDVVFKYLFSAFATNYNSSGRSL